MTVARNACLILAAAGLLAACGGGSSVVIFIGSPPPFTPPGTGTITLVAEHPGSYYRPGGIALDHAGTIYVGNIAQRRIYRISPGGTVSEFAGSSAVAPGTDGVGERAGFDYVEQLMFDKRSQTLYAIDRHYQETSGALRRITLAGEVGTVALTPFRTHVPPSLSDLGSAGDRAAVLAQGGDGTLYAATMLSAEPGSTSGGPHITYRGYRFLSWRSFDAAGKGRELFSQEIYYSRFGSPPDESSPNHLYPSSVSSTEGVLGPFLLGLVVDRAGNAYIADTSRHVIVKVTPAGDASIFAGKVKTPGAENGASTAARFNSPTQLVMDASDNLYVLDRDNFTVRKITPAGAVSTVVGVAGRDRTVTGNLPGGLGTPSAMTMDDSGRLYLTVNNGVVRVQLP